MDDDGLAVQLSACTVGVDKRDDVGVAGAPVVVVAQDVLTRLLWSATHTGGGWAALITSGSSAA